MLNEQRFFIEITNVPFLHVLFEHINIIKKTTVDAGAWHEKFLLLFLMKENKN